MGLPRCPHHLCDVPCPLPRRTGWVLLSIAFPIHAAFPVPGGSASATALSRPAQASRSFGPSHRSTALQRPLSRGFDAASPPATSLVSYRFNRLFSGWIPPPLVIRAFVAHLEARGPEDHERLPANARGTPFARRRRPEAPGRCRTAQPSPFR